MAANRRKTIEYAFATRITPLATATTLGAAARYDAPSVTLFIPELSARAFLSVRLVATFRSQSTAANTISGFRMGIKLGAAAPSDNDRSPPGISSAKNQFEVIDVDVTSYFNSNFGTGASQTCIASLAVSTSAAANINGITLKLVITYEFEDAAQPIRIKTVRIPIQSVLGTLTTTQLEVGTDGTSGAPANQIPPLDSFLPEASKVYRQIFVESTANDCNVSGTTAFTPFIQIDSGTEVARATIDETLSSTLGWRDILDLTSTLTTNAAHAFKLRCDLAARLCFANSTLVVTYQYDASASTTVLCEAMIPLTMSNDDSFGIATGEGFSPNVAADAQALIAAISVQESNPVLVQSAVYLNVLSYLNVTTLNVRAGAQTYRPYVVGGAAGGAVLGDVPLVHRVDHGGGWTLARGDNRLVLNVYASIASNSDLTGYALINYTATAPSDVDLATHPVNYFAAAYAASGSPNAVDVPAAGGGIRVPVLGTPYRVQGVMIEQYGRAPQNVLAPQLLIEQRAGELDGTGFVVTPLRHVGIQAVGSWRITSAMTRAFNLDHLHTGKLNLETARRQIAWNAANGWQSSWSWWITYHQLSFVVAGAVTVGGTPVPSGKSVEIYARDSAGNAERVTTATIASSIGTYGAFVVDNTRSYFVSYQDGATLGRSAFGTPGSSVFNVAIPAGVGSVPASAVDVTGRITTAGQVEVSWSYPGSSAAQGIVFDVYQSTDPTDLFRSACALGVAALVVQLSPQGLAGDRYFTVIARRGVALALPARPALVSVPSPATSVAPRTTVSVGPGPSGLGFPFGIAPTGGVIAQGGDALLRGKILQLLLTSPGERVNRPDYGTRLLDLVFDPNSEVLAATMEFTITRALQQAFDDEIQLDAVQLTATDATLLVDISYLRKADLTRGQVRVGVPLPQGAP